MNEHDLVEHLAGRAADVEVGPPPLDAVRRGARATRRARRAVVASVAAAVLVVVAVAVVHGPTRSTSAPAVAPPGYRLVAVGSVAVAVPQDWATNALGCGTPTRDTVVVGPYTSEPCASAYPPATNSVGIGEVHGVDTAGWKRVEIDGETALRTSEPPPELVSETAPFYGEVLLVDQGVEVLAQSSVSQQHVDDLLAGIVVLHGQVGLPGYSDLAGADQSQQSEEYQQALNAAGLVPVVRDVVRPGGLPGLVVGVDPPVGTVMSPGQRVTVTEIGRAGAPGIRLGFSASGAHGAKSFDDPLVRAEGRTSVHRGDLVTATMTGSEGAVVQASGPALEPEGPGRWRVVGALHTHAVIRYLDTSGEGPVAVVASLRLVVL